MASKGHAEPPEGAIVGESVPKESEPDNYDETLIEDTMHTLKIHPAYRGMNESELRERAIDYLRSAGVSL